MAILQTYNDITACEIATKVLAIIISNETKQYTDLNT